MASMEMIDSPPATGVSTQASSSSLLKKSVEHEVAAVVTLVEPVHAEIKEPSAARGTAFWASYLGLFIIAIASSVDALIITTALPTILADLGGGQSSYVWLANCYAIAQTAVQPLFGRLSDLLGRRIVMLSSAALFILGSGLGGGASSITMLIVGRSIQGCGAGGIIMLLDLITCDLLPLRQRPMYLGFILGACAIGTCLGPVIGGAIASGLNWRWTFWINLPIAGVASIVMFLFLKLKRPALPSFVRFIKEVDIAGSLLLTLSVVSLQIGLVSGGSVHPWGTAQVIVPIVLGALGLVAFFFYQSASFCSSPIVPGRLFSNRTSLIGFILVFLSSLLMQWASFFVPLYFQMVVGTNQLISGVDVLPLQSFMIPSAGIAGALLTKFGKYKPIHLTGFALMAVGFGLFSLMDRDTKTVQWVFSEIIAAMGFGALLTSCLPSIQAGLSDSDSAASTATYAFIRSFGFVWSVAIPGAIFSNQLTLHASEVDDRAAQLIILGGQAITGLVPYSSSITDANTRNQILQILEGAFRSTWYWGAGFAVLGFLAVFVERQLELRTALETNFGLEERPAREKAPSEPC